MRVVCAACTCGGGASLGDLRTAAVSVDGAGLSAGLHLDGLELLGHRSTYKQ